jgi:hypothetical protein
MKLTKTGLLAWLDDITTKAIRVVKEDASLWFHADQ